MTVIDVFFFLFCTDSDLLFPDDFEAPTRKEIFCNSHEQEKFLPDDGPGSSLLIDLNPGKTINSCKRFFSAPSPSGLFIRIIKSDTNKATMRALSSFNGNMHNTTEYCPISIVSYCGLDTEKIIISQSPARAFIQYLSLN